jgi:hypothetical protein
MEITRLPVGVVASSDTDCVRIEQEPDGTYRMTASALCAGGDDNESVSIVDGLPFPSAQEAEEAGLAWAQDVGAELLYISVGTLECPLQPTEIDLPL